MNSQELTSEFIRLMTCNRIGDCSDLLNMYSNYLLQTVKNHHDDSVLLLADMDAKLINQMMLTKALHIRDVIMGINFTAYDGTTLNDIIDPTFVGVLIRNVYETVGMFNLIYRTPQTADEKLILYNLWALAGLNYRQKFKQIAKTFESLQKAKDEDAQIARFIDEISQTVLYKSLDQKNKKKIDNCIKAKDFKIRFDNNNITILSWQQLAQTMGIKKHLFDEIYTYFSLYAHPSNVAVFQFGQLFEAKDKPFLSMLAFNLKALFSLMSIFVADYIHCFPSTINTFNNLPLIDQIAIDGFNTLYRGENFSINDSLKALY